MAWQDLTFVECSLLTAAKMTDLQGNFTALAQQHAGAPPVSYPNSALSVAAGMDAPGVNCLGTVHVASALVHAGVGSLGSVHVGSGLAVPGVSSLGALHVGSDLAVLGVSSLGRVDAASGFASLAVSSLDHVVLGGAAPSPPAAQALYTDNVCRAWINFDGTGTIAIRDSFNVSSITDNGTGDYTITWDTDFADTNYTVTGMAGRGAINEDAMVAFYRPSPRAVGSVRVGTLSPSGPAITDMPDVCLIAFGAQ